MNSSLLMVEDEAYLAMSLKELLSGAGYRVLHAARLEDALRIADQERMDGALLDINVHGEMVYPLADRLQSRGVPFTFVSAYSAISIPMKFRHYPLVQKPYTIDAIMEAVAAMLGNAPRSMDEAASRG